MESKEIPSFNLCLVNKEQVGAYNNSDLKIVSIYV